MLLIDPPLWPAHGRRWSHLVSDASLAELHAFARTVGIPPRGFEGDHYDVPEERYAQVVTAGAVPVTSRELLRRLRASGLRRPKRRGERVLASAGGPHDRVDLVLSSLPPLRTVGTAVRLLRARTRLLAVEDDADDGGLLLPESADGTTPEQLAHDLVGARVDLHQVAYLRPQAPAAPADVVLLGRAPAATPRRGRWVEADEAAALLPALLRPLVRGPFAP